MPGCICSARMSIGFISGSTAAPNRDVRSSRSYLPASALAQLSSDGVALARITRRTANGRPQNRHVTGAVMHAVFLFVRGVVFFIDHNQTQIPKWQEQRRTRPHDQLRVTLPDHPPNPATFGHCRTRVPLGRARAKPRLKPASGIRR